MKRLSAGPVVCTGTTVAMSVTFLPAGAPTACRESAEAGEYDPRRPALNRERAVRVAAALRIRIR
ncbi:hypothetical protein GCM10014713_65630 [Streptomyces purpureus]|uniref:Uncharacterized protein n=1 Tax=Streptomyces purpureus TaxID=1951 RepID=A0A918LX84_9ACTN|nr:hypothetical protein GCM10014713_65630 [Streptomyces purpureus]